MKNLHAISLILGMVVWGSSQGMHGCKSGEKWTTYEAANARRVYMSRPCAEYPCCRLVIYPTGSNSVPEAIATLDLISERFEFWWGFMGGSGTMNWSELCDRWWKHSTQTTNPCSKKEYLEDLCSDRSFQHAMQNLARQLGNWRRNQHNLAPNLALLAKVAAVHPLVSDLRSSGCDGVDEMVEDVMGEKL